MGGREADLVAVARITARSLAGYHTLREFAGDRVRDLRGDVARAGDAHGLIDIRTAGQRIADSAAKAGGRSAERLDLGRVVVSLVFEHQEPLLHLAVHVHIDVDAAGIVLLTLFLVVQKALGFQPAGAYGRELHQAEGLPLAAELAAHIIK